MNEDIIKIFGEQNNYLGVIPRDLQKMVTRYMLINPYSFVDIFSYSSKENINNSYFTGLINNDKNVIKLLWLKHVSTENPRGSNNLSIDYDDLTFDEFLTLYQNAIECYQNTWDKKLEEYDIIKENDEIIGNLVGSIMWGQLIDESDIKKLVYIDQIYGGSTLLMLCSEYSRKNRKNAELLLKLGANPNIKNSNKEDALILLLERSINYKYIKLLVDNGANIKTMDCYGNNLLMLAIKNYGEIKKIRENKKDNLIMITKYFLDNGIDINAENNDRETALIMAVRYGCLEFIQFLVSQGAILDGINPNEKKCYFPLMEATSYGHYDIITYLIEKGVNINELDILNTTALLNFIVVITDRGGNNNKDMNLKMVHYMINKGADINIKYQNISTVLDFVINKFNNLSRNPYNYNIYKYDNIKCIIELLMDYGTDYESDLLNILKFCSDTDILVSKTIKNYRNIITGDTTLLIAYKNNQNDLINYLLDKGVDPTIKNNSGETIISLAEKDLKQNIITCIQPYIKRSP